MRQKRFFLPGNVSKHCKEGVRSPTFQLTRFLWLGILRMFAVLPPRSTSYVMASSQDVAEVNICMGLFMGRRNAARRKANNSSSQDLQS